MERNLVAYVLKPYLLCHQLFYISLEKPNKRQQKHPPRANEGNLRPNNIYFNSCKGIVFGNLAFSVELGNS